MQDIAARHGLSVERTRMHIDREDEAIIPSNLMSNVFPIYCPCTMFRLTLHLDTTFG